MTLTAGRSRALFLLFAFLCAGCVSEKKETSPDSFMGRMRNQPADKENPSAPSHAQPTARSTPPPVVDTPPAANQRQARPAPTPARPPAPVAQGPNTRVMLYQPKGDLLMILVNDSHTGRATEAGRLDLALGDPNRAYKILTDGQMEALLTSLVAAGYDQNATEFVPDDAQYLNASSADLPRYQGMLSVERGSSKTKLLGYRKSSEGDAMGARRYIKYTELKILVQKWFGDSSRSEYPVGGVTLPPKGPTK